MKACLASQKRCINTGEHRALSVEICHKWVEIRLVASLQLKRA